MRKQISSGHRTFQTRLRRGLNRRAVNQLAVQRDHRSRLYGANGAKGSFRCAHKVPSEVDSELGFPSNECAKGPSEIDEMAVGAGVGDGWSESRTKRQESGDRKQLSLFSNQLALAIRHSSFKQSFPIKNPTPLSNS